MTKVVIAKLKQRGNTSVKTKRVRSASGKFQMFHTLDADSPTFANDLNLIFRKNVAKARRGKK
jgi:hypothetical protein